MTRVSRASAGLPGFPARHRCSRKGTSLPREKRVKKVNPDFRECQASGRKANPGSQGLEGSPGRTARRGSGAVRASPVTQGTQGSQASRASREIKAKLVLLANPALS